MARRSGRCVHCLKESDDITDDHVLPKSWYPDSTPLDLEKWTVPACNACNHRYGKIEEDLLLRFGMCLSPDELSAGVGSRALRAAKPEFAKNERDRRVRDRKRQKILAEIRRLDEAPSGVFPGFGPLLHLEYDGYSIILIPAASLIAFGEKLIRAVTYLDEQAFLGNGYRIAVYIVDEEKVIDVDALLDMHAVKRHRGPGFSVERAKADEDPLTALFKIRIWGRFQLYGIAYAERFADLADELRTSLAT